MYRNTEWSTRPDTWTASPRLIKSADLNTDTYIYKLFTIEFPLSREGHNKADRIIKMKQNEILKLFPSNDKLLQSIKFIHHDDSQDRTTICLTWNNKSILGKIVRRIEGSKLYFPKDVLKI